LSTVGGRSEAALDVSSTALHSALQMYENDVSTLMDQLHGARARQWRVISDSIDERRQRTLTYSPL